jgi:hypothetical protein
MSVQTFHITPDFALTAHVVGNDHLVRLASPGKAQDLLSVALGKDVPANGILLSQIVEDADIPVTSLGQLVTRLKGFIPQ